MPRNGSATSLKKGTSPQETLTSEASLTCGPTTSAATHKPISSLASEDGRSRSELQAGQTTDLFGQARALVSHSPSQARARRPMTNVTCGLRGFLSSPSAALQSSLESRLKRRLDGVGSTLFSLTWKAKATPAGRPYCQLVASARRTSDSDFGSWPTPTAAENIGDLEKKNERRARMKEKWKGRSGNGFGHSMSEIAQMAPWPTPMAGTPARNGNSEAGNNDSSRRTVALASWATPRTSDTNGAGLHGNGGADLRTQASWATPSARDWKDTGDLEQSRFRKDGKERNDTIPRQASGMTPNGLHAQTENPGQLDPDHSRWVMGYSAAHLSCAPTETPSFLKSQRSSFVPRAVIDNQGT